MDAPDTFDLSYEDSRFVVSLRRRLARVLHHEFFALFRAVECAKVLPCPERRQRIHAVSSERRHQGIPAEQHRDDRVFHLRISMT